MIYVDTKYISLVSGRLEKFSKKNENLFNFRCPYCGDSQKNRNRARGYFYRHKGSFIYKCHNCGVGRTLSNFLKDQDPDLYGEYVMEAYREGNTGKGTKIPLPDLKFEKPSFNKDIFSNLEKISDLNITHPARRMLADRQLPSNTLSELYFCPKFKQWTNQQKKTFTDTRYDDARIIIPLKDKDGVFGFQGRAIESSALRYITVMLDEDKPKIYGLDKIDETKPIYIVEGPFDSLFLDNSVAMCGSDLDPRTFGWSDYIWVYDNEPRNREIVERINKTVSRGDQVIIWPKHVQQKDINDMVLSGHNIKNLLESNTYRKLEATLKLKDWNKV